MEKDSIIIWMVIPLIGGGIIHYVIDPNRWMSHIYKAKFRLLSVSLAGSAYNSVHPYSVFLHI